MIKQIHLRGLFHLCEEQARVGFEYCLAVNMQDMAPPPAPFRPPFLYTLKGCTQRRVLWLARAEGAIPLQVHRLGGRHATGAFLL